MHPGGVPGVGKLRLNSMWLGFDVQPAEHPRARHTFTYQVMNLRPPEGTCRNKVRVELSDLGQTMSCQWTACYCPQGGSQQRNKGPFRVRGQGRGCRLPTSQELQGWRR